MIYVMCINFVFAQNDNICQKASDSILSQLVHYIPNYNEDQELKVTSQQKDSSCFITITYQLKPIIQDFHPPQQKWSLKYKIIDNGEMKAITLNEIKSKLIIGLDRLKCESILNGLSEEKKENIYLDIENPSFKKYLKTFGNLIDSPLEIVRIRQKYFWIQNTDHHLDLHISTLYMCETFLAQEKKFSNP